MLIQDQFGIIQYLQMSPMPQTCFLVGTFLRHFLQQTIFRVSNKTGFSCPTAPTVQRKRDKLKILPRGGTLSWSQEKGTTRQEYFLVLESLISSHPVPFETLLFTNLNKIKTHFKPTSIIFEIFYLFQISKILGRHLQI